MDETISGKIGKSLYFCVHKGAVMVNKQYTYRNRMRFLHSEG